MEFISGNFPKMKITSEYATSRQLDCDHSPSLEKFIFSSIIRFSNKSNENLERDK